jgi:hypothetical protein
MPMSFDLQEGALWFRTWDDVVYDEGIAVLERGLEAALQASAQRRWPVVFDIRESRENRSADELRGIAEFVAAHDGVLSGHCAVLASDALHFGLGRMFEAFSQEHGIDVRVFREPEALVAWLEVETRDHSD